MQHSDIRITIIVDNYADPGLTIEHGLSIYIETGRQRILFDTGQGKALLPNARKLGVDLSRIDRLILSHGHYDHTGGIPDLLQNGGDIDVYCHPGVTQPRYAIRDGVVNAIHMPGNAMVALNRVPERRLHWVMGPMTLEGNLNLTGPIPRKTAYEDTGGPFYLDPHGSRVDPLVDDLTLWIPTERGLVVVAGCCHAGLVNTLNHIQALSGGAPIHAIIGGLHLLNATPQRIAHTAATLKSLAPAAVIPCHCTGEHAITALKATLGDIVSPGKAGATYLF